MYVGKQPQTRYSAPSVLEGTLVPYMRRNATSRADLACGWYHLLSGPKDECPSRGNLWFSHLDSGRRMADANHMLAHLEHLPETQYIILLRKKEKKSQGLKEPAASDNASQQAAPAHPLTLMSLGTDDASLILSHFSAPGLARLRATCSTARAIVDLLPVWAEMLQEMNKINRYNISPFDNKPFVWLPAAERDEGYDQRLEAFQGFALEDPRIARSFASLNPFDKSGRVYSFLRKSVERIQRHIPAGDILQHIDSGYGKGEDPRFQAFLPLARLNTAMEDLCNSSGPRWYRDNGKRPDRVIEEARGPLLTAAIHRLYDCFDQVAGEIPIEDRWMKDYDSANDSQSDHDKDGWGSNAHLQSLALKRAASSKLRHFLGEDACERIEVLGDARRRFREIMILIEGQEFRYNGE